ncbi:MAG: DHHA1 domain-containing protein, partial [Bacillota bacterium]|nr:DHHA1 domain-containing protein [Bacillota bacterium]
LAKAISLPYITSERIAFGIAPHINAAGRMASADEAVTLFMTEDEKIQEEQIKKLVAFNSQRKEKQQKAFEQCMEQITGDEDFILLNMSDIHEGIGGIVAGKIKETVNRPAVILTPSDEGFLKGTGRSIPSVDIYALLKKNAHLFERFGGHRSACGFLMKEENLPQLRYKMGEEMEQLKVADPNLFRIPVEWELELTPGEITLELAEELERLEPFGQGNPKPAFLMKNVMSEQLRFMGEEQTHVRFTARKDPGQATCVLFQRAQEKKELLMSGQPIDVVGTVARQSWRGQENVQFMVEEILPWRE